MKIARSAKLSVPALLALFVLTCAHGTGAADTEAAPIRLRIVGGLANVHQFTRHEQPFWEHAVPALTKGRVVADVVPFDQAGLRGTEVLRLMQAGIVPFGTAMLGASSSTNPEWAAPDLAGLNPDLASLRRAVQAYRPYLRQALRDRYGIELLAVYVYPAQVIYCKRRFTGIGDLVGRRIRTATPSQGDYIEAIGGVPVHVPFSEAKASLAAGNTDCAITGTMSGNTIGLHEVTTYVAALPVTWGLSVFGANEAAWSALPVDIRSVLQGGLAHLEEEIWDEAGSETAEGLACNAGHTGCINGRPGAMVIVPANDADKRLQRQVFQNTVLPRWLLRCGPQCNELWTRYLRDVTGFDIQPAPRK